MFSWKSPGDSIRNSMLGKIVRVQDLTSKGGWMIFERQLLALLCRSLH